MNATQNINTDNLLLTKHKELPTTGEMWAYIPNMQNKYLISSFGRVFNTYDSVWVAQVLAGGNPYFYVNLQPPPIGNNKQKRKLCRVNKILAEAFLNNPQQHTIVDHIDRNQYNNSLDNLRWISRKGNARNTSTNILCEYEGKQKLLVEVCEEVFGEDYKTYYQNMVTHFTKHGDIQAAIQHTIDVTGKGRKTPHTKAIIYEDEEVLLVELCSKLDLAYKQTLGRLNNGWTIDDCLKGKRDREPKYIIRGVNYYSLTEVARAYKISESALKDRRDKFPTLEEALLWDPLDEYRKDVNIQGKPFRGTYREIADKIGVTVSALSARVGKGATLQEAVDVTVNNDTTKSRVKFYTFFGIKDTRKFWLGLVNIKPNKINKLRQKRMNFEQSLQHLLGDNYMQIIHTKLIEVGKLPDERDNSKTE